MFNPNPSMPWLTPYPGGGHRSPTTDTAPIISNATGTPDEDPYTKWFNSAVGQAWNAAQVSAAQQARKVADEEIAAKKRELDIEVEKLRQQGRQHEAEMKLREGELQLSRERLAMEMEIKRAELGLSQQRLGLDTATAYANFASGPDMMFARNDFVNALGRAGQDLGPQPYGAEGRPQMRTWEDFQRAMGGGSQNEAGSPADPTRSIQPVGAGTGPMRGGGNAVTDANGDGIPDNRVKAAKAVLDAIPPSEGDGTDENDMAALQAVENIFRARRPGALQRMRPGQQQAFAAGLARLGYVPGDAIADMQRAGIGQGGVRQYR